MSDFDFNDLKSVVDARIQRAYEALGHRPGPGTDICIRPTNPISNLYSITGLTPAGDAFITKFFGDRCVASGQPMKQFKETCMEWGLRFETDWSCIVDVRE